jgi:catechol 2,3-dioxygenase-like lactoylglutathione lyase family enzyme
MTAAITFRRVIPILRIFDVAKADEFYLDYLGFRVDWDHRYDDNAPLYRQISRGDLVLHLSEHHGDGSPGGSAPRADGRNRGLPRRARRQKLPLYASRLGEDGVEDAGDRSNRSIREHDQLLRASR